MRLHRFIGNFDLCQGPFTVTDSELISQWKNVLRLKTGDQLILCDGAGQETLATITDSGKKEVKLLLEIIKTPDREPLKKVTLYCALLKRENFEFVCQKATEVGVTTIVPLLTERTVKTGFNRERLEKIIKEASEQSGRTIVPFVHEPVEFVEAMESTDPKDTVLFDLSGETFASEERFVSIMIGPEGGFSDPEVALAKKAGCTIASLGALTLRGETAAIVASFLATR